MTMNVGAMNRLVEIQEPVRTKNSMNEDVVTWRTFGRVWAERKIRMAPERNAASQVRAVESHNYLIWFQEDLTTEMRIYDEGKYYQILGVAEIGTHEGQELTTEYLQTRGDGS